MVAGTDIRLEQAQKLVFRNELQQAVAILQLSSQELASYIERQLVENPLLDLKEEDEGDDKNGWDDTDKTSELEYPAEWIDYFSGSSDLGFSEDAGRAMQEPPGTLPSLYDHLISQINLLQLSTYDYLICEYIIGNIGADGYFRVDLQEVAQSLGVPVAAVEKVLRLVQTLDPPGIGARDLKECLFLQAKAVGLAEGLVGAVISDHLKAVAEGRFARIARELGVGVEEVVKAVETIRRFNPKPGSGFIGEPVQYLIPDVIIQKVGGDYVVIVNETGYPRLTINRTYQDLVHKDGSSPELRSFIQTRLKQALWVIKSIEQRRTTLYRIVTALVQKQRGFLDAGISALRPLTLKEVAQTVGLHESTVSRAVAQKYVQCPRGIFKLKFFFSGGVSENSGSPVASQSVKWLIKDIVAGENPDKPLSDREITSMLRQRGISVSRRTVAKYRADLNIPGAAKRRGRSEV